MYTAASIKRRTHIPLTTLSSFLFFTPFDLLIGFDGAGRRVAGSFGTPLNVPEQNVA